MINYNKKIILSLSFLLIIIVIYAINVTGTITYSEKEDERKIKEFFATGNSQLAVKYYVDKYKEDTNPLTHQLEHLLGENLYIKEGLNGLSFCPDSDMAGCYHGFFIEASLSEKNDDWLKYSCHKINNFMKTLSCVHGMGHGFMAAHYGTDINQILLKCEGIFEVFMQNICYSGVFMEYHTGMHSYKIDTTDVFSPCETVQERYKWGCYLEITRWWDVIFKKDVNKIIKLCNSLKNENHSEGCFRGTGEMFTVNSDYTINEIVRGCLHHTLPRGRFYCFTESAKLLMGRYNKEPESICKYLVEKEAELCSENARKEMAIATSEFEKISKYYE